MTTKDRQDFDTQTFVAEVEEVSGTLGGGSDNRGWCDDPDRAGAFIPQTTHSLTADGFDASEDGTGRGTPLVSDVHSVCLGSDPISAENLAMPQTTRNGDPGVVAYSVHSDKSEAKAMHATEVDVVKCLDAKEGYLGARGGTVVGFSCKDHGHDAMENTAPTLRAMGHDGSHQNGGGQLAVAVDLQNTRLGSSDVMGTLDTTCPSRGGGQAVMQRMTVRRLTPIECERLQGFPEGWTKVPFNGKDAADGPRYRALGNSFATPVVRWLGCRIQRAEEGVY